ncbi:MAG TPA: hypothetical protein VFD27_12315, partial [Chthoniobacteraceae bacterium]|nr:hypothetical protein [Chthoniobacteraceae bacterium]
MKRSGPPARKTPIKRGGRPKARNPKRRASEFERCYHSHERVEWVSAQRCAVCLSEVFNGCDNAHIAGDGMGRKGSY